MKMEVTTEAPIVYYAFVAGSTKDPKPDINPFKKRFARCLSCQTILVHWSSALQSWVDDCGRFHSQHELEFPYEWLPKGFVTEL